MKQPNELAPLIIASFRLEKTGLVPLGTPTFENWLACGRFLKNAENSSQFWIGDWLIYGEGHLGKTDYEKAIALTGFSYQTLRIYKHVSAAVPISLRRNKLSFHHHKEVASLAQDTRDLLLDQAENNGWPVIKLKHEKYRYILEQSRPVASVAPISRLLYGESLAKLTTVTDSTFDLVVSAPRFDIHTNETLQAIFRELARCLKINSHVYLFLNRYEYARVLPLIKPYFTVKNLLVYETKEKPSSSSSRYTSAYNFILFAHKGRRHLSGRRDASVFRWTADLPGDDTPPLALLEYLMEKSSQPGEVVGDPFAGGCVVGTAAKNKGRHFIGIEGNSVLFAQGLKRLGLV